VDYPLGSLGLQIKAHWQKYRPQMYAQLQREGSSRRASTRPKNGRTTSWTASWTRRCRITGVGAGEGGVGVPPSED